jgi:hypothetical protein
MSSLSSYLSFFIIIIFNLHIYLYNHHHRHSLSALDADVRDDDCGLVFGQLEAQRTHRFPQLWCSDKPSGRQ